MTQFEKIYNAYEKSGKPFDYVCLEGCLLNNYIFWGEGLKTTIIRETYINSWTSGEKVRFYNNTPKKYNEIIRLCVDGETEKAEKLFFA